MLDFLASYAGGTEDETGMILVIPQSGCLNLDGARGVFLSVEAICDWLKDDDMDGWEEMVESSVLFFQTSLFFFLCKIFNLAD